MTSSFVQRWRVTASAAILAIVSAVAVTVGTALAEPYGFVCAGIGTCNGCQPARASSTGAPVGYASVSNSVFFSYCVYDGEGVCPIFIGKCATLDPPVPIYAASTCSGASFPSANTLYVYVGQCNSNGGT
jgi:hypothetical protein